MNRPHWMAATWHGFHSQIYRYNLILNFDVLLSDRDLSRRNFNVYYIWLLTWFFAVLKGAHQWERLRIVRYYLPLCSPKTCPGSSFYLTASIYPSRMIRMFIS